MSITSTLTTIGAAGAGGGVSYWINEITFSGSNGVIGSVMDASPDLVCVGARTIGASNDGTFLVLNQDGILQNKTNNTVDGDQLLHPNGLLYDLNTDAWYTTISDGSRQLAGRFSGDPSGGYTWLKDLGYTGADTEHTVMQPDGSNIIFSTRISDRAGVYKIAKSDGAKINFKSYLSGNGTTNNVTIAKGNEYTTQLPVVGTRTVSGYGSTTVIGNLTTSLGSVSSGFYIYSYDAAGRSEVALDGSGNAYGMFQTYFWSTDTSGNLRFNLNNFYGKFVAYAWAETGNYLLALTEYGDLMRIDPTTGQPQDGERRSLTGGDIQSITGHQYSDLKIDEENNIVWYTKTGVNGEIFVIKRPLDSSLDGTYGSFTLSTNAASFQDYPYIYKTNQSWNTYTEGASQSDKTASISSDFRWFSSLQKIG